MARASITTHLTIRNRHISLRLRSRGRTQSRLLYPRVDDGMHVLALRQGNSRFGCACCIPSLYSRQEAPQHSR